MKGGNMYIILEDQYCTNCGLKGCMVTIMVGVYNGMDEDIYLCSVCLAEMLIDIAKKENIKRQEQEKKLEEQTLKRHVKDVLNQIRKGIK